MRMFNKVLGPAVLLLAIPSAFASLTITTSGTQLSLTNLVPLTGFTFTGNAGLVFGGKTGDYAAPYVPCECTLDPWLTGTASVPGLTSHGQTQDQYMYVEEGGTATHDFTGNQNSFSLLWGSVDRFNTLEFFEGNTLVATVTGAELPTNSGFQGPDGSLWVKITGIPSFDKVEFESSGNSFESLAYTSALQTTPEPGFYGILALGLTALVFAARRRRVA